MSLVKDYMDRRRQKKFRLNGEAPPPGIDALAPAPAAEPATEPVAVTEDIEVISNYIAVKDRGKTIRVGRQLPAIAADLAYLSGDWPRRVGGLLFAPTGAYEPLWLVKTEDLFAWLGGRWSVRWTKGDDVHTKAEFSAYLRQSVQAYMAVEAFPHQPPMPEHFYLHPQPAGGDGRALAGLVDRFRAETDLDRALILAMFLTLLWGGEPGERPMFLIHSDKDEDEDGTETGTGIGIGIGTDDRDPTAAASDLFSAILADAADAADAVAATGDDDAAADAAGDDDTSAGRGFGKSTLAQMAGRLVGGSIHLRQGEDINRLMCRLLTPGALTKRVALLDNVKSLRFSWSDLESLVTSEVVNGYQLYVGDATRPNTLTWMLTLNGASLSKDLAQRCVIIRLARPTYDAAWRKETKQYIDSNRWAIIGDCLAALGGPKAELESFTRWASWEEEVLAACPDPAACQRLVAIRQAAVDCDQEDADLIHDAIASMLRDRGHDPDQDVIFLTSKELTPVVNEALEERRTVSQTSKYLGTLAIAELRRSSKHGRKARGWRWAGTKSDAGQAAVPLNSVLGPIEPKPEDTGLVASMKATERAKRQRQGQAAPRRR
jgi:hypothetical protein